MKKIIFCIALVLVLSGCGIARKKPVAAPALYDFGLMSSSQTLEKVLTPLILEVRVPLGMASSRAIHYRLLYEDPLRLYEYAEARWAAAPANLIRQRLLQQLNLPFVPSAASSCRLMIEMDEFGQIFHGPDQSKGLVAGEAILLDRTGQRIDVHRFRIETPAKSGNGVGGVAALATGVDHLGSEMKAWLKTLQNHAKMASCRG